MRRYTVPVTRREDTTDGNDDIDRQQTENGRQQTGPEQAASLDRHWRRTTGSKTPKEDRRR
jgi:hypothetical protein